MNEEIDTGASDTAARNVAVVRFAIVALFSMRAPTTNAFTARTLLCPTPAATKLALLAALLRRDGPDSGQEHLDWLAPLPVAWRPPDRMAVTAATVSIWKGDTAGEPLRSSVGMREYMHADAPFALAFGDIPPERHDDFAQAAMCVRHLGVTESFVQPLGLAWEGAMPPGFVFLTAAGGGVPGGVTCVVDDLGNAPSFARLSPFRANTKEFVPRIPADRQRFIIGLPLRVTRTGADGYTVERVRPAGEGAR